MVYVGTWNWFHICRLARLLDFVIHDRITIVVTSIVVVVIVVVVIVVFVVALHPCCLHIASTAYACCGHIVSMLQSSIYKQGSSGALCVRLVQFKVYKYGQT